MAEGFSRRKFMTGAAMAGAAAMAPKETLAADKEKTPEEKFQELKDQVADIEKRFERFNGIQDENLKAGVGKKFAPEMLHRIKEAKDDAQAQGAYAALAEQGTERLHEINAMYKSLKDIENELNSILKAK